jgi:hypothetical protein
MHDRKTQEIARMNTIIILISVECLASDVRYCEIDIRRVSSQALLSKRCVDDCLDCRMLRVTCHSHGRRSRHVYRVFG